MVPDIRNVRNKAEFVTIDGSIVTASVKKYSPKPWEDYYGVKMINIFETTEVIFSREVGSKNLVGKNK